MFLIDLNPCVTSIFSLFYSKIMLETLETSDTFFNIYIEFFLQLILYC